MRRRSEPKGRWESADLVRRLLGALDVAEQVLEHLATAGYTDAGEPSVSVRPEKAVAETAVLLLAASSVDGRPEVSRRLDQLASLLIPHARGPRTRMGICFEPALALDYAQAHACLAKMGHPDPAFDALLRQALTAQSFGGRERPPHRGLEQHWTAELIGMQSLLRPPHFAKLAAQSALARPMDLFGGSREDVYAFTHAFMYATDPHLTRKRLPRSRTEVLLEAEVALAKCLDQEDYDLGGEVLLAWPSSGRTWSATAAFAFRVLARVEDEAGFLPSAGLRMKRVHALAGRERSNYVLAASYHTAYVMGLLCAASLRPGREPPLRLRAPEVPAETAALARRFVQGLEVRPHWTRYYDDLLPEERDALVRFVLTVSLHRACKARDLDVIRQVLELAHSSGMSDGPGASQAAELLQRAAVFAGASIAAVSSGAGVTHTVPCTAQVDNVQALGDLEPGATEAGRLASNA